MQLKDVPPGSCLLTVNGELTFTGSLVGSAAGTTNALETAPCSAVLVNPPGTFSDAFQFRGHFAKALPNPLLRWAARPDVSHQVIDRARRAVAPPTHGRALSPRGLPRHRYTRGKGHFHHGRLQHQQQGPWDGHSDPSAGPVGMPSRPLRSSQPRTQHTELIKRTRHAERPGEKQWRTRNWLNPASPSPCDLSAVKLDASHAGGLPGLIE